MPTYDYIIIGAGAAGLMLADTMGKDAFFAEKSILLLDKDTKETNDRTWCFWEKGTGLFDLQNGTRNRFLCYIFSTDKNLY